VEDSNTIEDEEVTCFTFYDRLKPTTTEGNPDYFTLHSDKWYDGGFKFGCLGKDSNWQCNSSCYPFDGTFPDWSNKGYLTFLAKAEGTTVDCKPSFKLVGGAWPWKSSNQIILEGSYVDKGDLTANEWHRALIPIPDLKTLEWDLNEVNGIHFSRCVDHPQPTYHIASLAVTNKAIELLSSAPSSSPSVYVTADLLLATHRFIHTNWYPILRPETEPEGNVWVSAENNSWPNIGSADPHTVTVVIPQDQTVVYSGTDTIKYDKIIVEGSLTIQPDESNVFLSINTIVVEREGTLDIKTDNDSPYTIKIEIDGALDHNKDPEETMVGILALEGNLAITGNEVVTKMADLGDEATIGSNLLTINGIDLGFDLGGELVLPDTQIGLDVAHWSFSQNKYVDQTEICQIQNIEHNLLGGVSLITCKDSLVHQHTAGSYVAYITRSIMVVTSPTSINRGHILHTGVGNFEIRNTRIENFGRTTTELINSTVMSPTDLKFPPLMSQMHVSHLGTNQIARYALHAHHSLIEAYFTGNALIDSPRDGMVAHNSRVHIIDNIIVAADGTGIFLEDATETGPVTNNYIIGTGGGSRGGDDGRFGTQKGLDMAHGGFGIWCRGKLALVQGNHAEGHFGFAPYAFFVHPSFVSTKRVPDVPGTPTGLVGKTLQEISNAVGGSGLQLQSYGGFVSNTAVASFQIGIDLSYFSNNQAEEVGSIVDGAQIRALASSGRGVSTTHISIFTFNDVKIEGVVEDNTITGIWCNNCNGCTLSTPNTNLVFENIYVDRGGNC